MTDATASPLTATRVSTAQDFPNLTIWREAGGNGPIYRIAFDNLEFGGARRLIRFMATALVALIIPLAIWSGVLAQWAGLHWLIGIVLCFALVWLTCHMGIRPGKIERTIELDFGNDRLRVLRGNRIEIERPRSRLDNVTVQAHPDAEFARASRLEKGQQTLKDVEKQHCLIGWFGAGGGEQLVLLCRAEWPNRNSLFEVRQAMLWAMAQAEGRQAQEPKREPVRPGVSALNPPLD
ncbi:MAG TPA: hypothetical protein VMN03_01045 [Burkholderiales bacterium]|nr:hypothetical protein [Burkholderiales bacterium]